MLYHRQVTGGFTCAAAGQWREAVTVVVARSFLLYTVNKIYNQPCFVYLYNTMLLVKKHLAS